jgi:hypothetical protein
MCLCVLCPGQGPGEEACGRRARRQEVQEKVDTSTIRRRDVSICCACLTSHWHANAGRRAHSEGVFSFVVHVPVKETRAPRTCF